MFQKANVTPNYCGFNSVASRKYKITIKMVLILLFMFFLILIFILFKNILTRWIIEPFLDKLTQILIENSVFNLLFYSGFSSDPKF